MPMLIDRPIDVAELQRAIEGPARGGVVTFVGTVRNHHAGNDVVELEYSAYGPMAEQQMAGIVTEAERRWPVTVSAQHRLGRLTIGDVAVAVAVAGVHRDEAFEACRFVIEAIKDRVPVWKRERYADGSEAWVDPTAPGQIRPVSGRAAG
jgi:molybdopterin synthase catalytic subunit